jgi:hypothetical protein
MATPEGAAYLSKLKLDDGAKAQDGGIAGPRRDRLIS